MPLYASNKKRVSVTFQIQWRIRNDSIRLRWVGSKPSSESPSSRILPFSCELQSVGLPFRGCESIRKIAKTSEIAGSFLPRIHQETLLRASWSHVFFEDHFWMNTFTAPKGHPYEFERILLHAQRHHFLNRLLYGGCL